MSFWDEIDTTREEISGLTSYPNIYRNTKGRYVTYTYVLATKHYVGTFDSLKEAYEAQEHFKETGQKRLSRKKIPLHEELKSLINEYHEQHPTTPNPKEQIFPFHT